MVHTQLKNLPLAVYKRYDIPRLKPELAQMDNADKKILKLRELLADKYFNRENKSCEWLEQ